MSAIWKQEPRLTTLLEEAKRVKETPNFCANAIWYGHWVKGTRCIGLKERMAELVGWGRPGSDAILRSEVAYDEAYDRIYEVLPDCNHSSEFCWG